MGFILRGMFLVKVEYLYKYIPTIINENAKPPKVVVHMKILYWVKMGDLKRFSNDSGYNLMSFKLIARAKYKYLRQYSDCNVAKPYSKLINLNKMIVACKQDREEL